MAHDKPIKIMVADDEESMRRVIGRIVKGEGFEVCHAADGQEVLDTFFEEAPDLVILDVMMPRLDGFEACRRLRELGVGVPIIFLSAKGDIIDKGTGFSAGADDYLAKPFSAKELVLRIHARLQQHERAAQQGQGVVGTTDLKLDERRRKVSVGERSIDLTLKEFQILHLLSSHPGQVFTREQIIEYVWGDEFVGETSSVAVFIRRIREKIERDPSHPRYIQTVWRVGYKFGD